MGRIDEKGQSVTEIDSTIVKDSLDGEDLPNTTIGGVDVTNHSTRHESGGADPLALGSIAGIIDDTQHGSRAGGTTHATVAATIAGFQFPSKTNAIVAPSATDDSSAGYQVGSYWVDTVEGTTYRCVDNTATAAVWVQDSNDPNVISSAQERPRRIFLGSLTDYPAQGSFSPSSVIQYIQLWLVQGTVIEALETFIDGGGSSGSDIRLGVYDQADPDNENGIPVDKLAQTAARTLVGGDDGTYVALPLESGDLTISTTGYYWLALITDGSTPKFAVTSTFRANFLPRREESSTNVDLPATAGTLSNPSSAAVYAAVVRQ